MSIQKILVKLFQERNSLFKKCLHLEADKMKSQYFCVKDVLWHEWVLELSK